MNANKTSLLYTFILIITVALLSTSCSAKHWYVSSQGNDANKGTSEKAPFKTLSKAISIASTAKKDCSIIVIGVLNTESEGTNGKAVFIIGKTGEGVLTIAGKERSQAGQQAVLNGAGTELPVLWVEGNTALKFENIEISGSSKEGIIVTGGSTVTLGKGLKISGNSGAGIIVEEKSALFMEEGEISGNGERGVYVAEDCNFTMLGGLISKNLGPDLWGGGVFIGGSFIMEGGIISENLVESKGDGRGGGVCIYEEATFTLKGGQIINNKVTGWNRRGGVTNGSAGGVVICGYPSGKTAFIMEGGEISGNSTERYGGGVLLITNQGEKGTFTMTGGSITGNTATGGGGVYDYGGRFTVTINGGDVSGNTPNDVSDGWYW